MSASVHSLIVAFIINGEKLIKSDTSMIVVNLVESFPLLANPITEYLQATDQDSEDKARFKMAIEGGIIGVGLDSLLSFAVRGKKNNLKTEKIKNNDEAVKKFNTKRKQLAEKVEEATTIKPKSLEGDIDLRSFDRLDDVSEKITDAVFDQYYNDNMFITKKKFFINYCNIIFPWLEKCFKYCQENNLCKDYNTRLPAFLAERFTSFWFSKFNNRELLSYARLGNFHLSNKFNSFLNTTKIPCTYYQFPTIHKF